MIEKLKDFSFKIINNDSQSKKFNKDLVVAVEMIKLDNYYYVIDKKLELVEINYGYQDELDKIMMALVKKVAEALKLDQCRLIYHDSRTINIELEVETAELELKPNLRFYGFYEINSERVFLLSFADQLREDIEYAVIMDVDKKIKFPFSADPDDRYIN